MPKDDDLRRLHEETRSAWEANAAVWDERMGDEGNDFANVLCWPAIQRLLNPQPGQRIIDAACGNGLFSRRLAGLGAEVVAFDFSAALIERAKARTRHPLSSPKGTPVTFHVLDATDETALLETLGAFASSSASGSLVPFDSALCNMALFDIADDAPLFRALAKLLKPDGTFVFSITHPAFNNASSAHVAEQVDDEGEIKTVYSVKLSCYMTPYERRGLALSDQPQAQVYFERPLQYYLNLGFQNGFVLDGFEERAFPPGHPQGNPLGWGGNFSEIPPVLVARMRLSP